MRVLAIATALVAAFSSPSIAQQQGGFVPGLTKAEMAAAIAAPVTASPSVPASGPGAGLCRETVVSSSLITSAGVTGSAGTCSTIIQCGTSSAYVVKQFNVGSGC